MFTFRTWGYDNPLILDGMSHQLRYYYRNRARLILEMRARRARKPKAPHRPLKWPNRADEYSRRKRAA